MVSTFPFKPRKGLMVFSRRIMSMAEDFEVDTQKIRARLIHELEALVELAQQKAIDTHPKKWKEKQNWTRLAAYIRQVINSISKTYDKVQIKAKIKELRERIKEAQEEWRREAAKP